MARILIIEDDEVLRERMAVALEGAGFKAITASNALEGLKSSYESNPDLVIMASDLPMVNREEPCLRLREETYMPIIILGGNEEAAEMLELGADAYMAKPPNLSELVARVRALLRRKPRYNPPRGNHNSDIDNRLP